MDKLKKRIYEIIDVAKPKDLASKIFDASIIFLIFINIFILIIETYNISQNFREVLTYIEMFSVIIFTIEYFLRIWTAEYLYENSSKYTAKIKYIASVNGLIDLLAILPMYIPNILPKGVLIIRICRTLRIFKLFKINRRFDTLNIVTRVLKKKFTQLVSTLYLISALMLASSILMYNAEHAAQPEIFKNAFSGFWWTVSTVATIGYGDIYPVTITGKILGIIITLLGISIVALPTSILTAGFIEESELTSRKKKGNYCPHCGEKINN